MNYLIGIGSNIGNAENNVNNAIKALSLLPKTKVVRASSLYESSPVGYAEQSNFINPICEAESEFDIHEMLGACLGIEAGFGRLRTVRFGPRIIDIDIIFAENEKIESRNLILPHPRYHERRFILEPMLDIFKDGVAYGIDFKKYIDKIDGQEVKKV